jgi:hypothetical protein
MDTKRPKPTRRRGPSLKRASGVLYFLAAVGLVVVISPSVRDAMSDRYSRASVANFSFGSIAGALGGALGLDGVAAAIKDSQNARAAEGEKQTGADNELEQAEINQEAMDGAVQAVADADMTLPLDACETADSQEDLDDSKISSENWRRTLTAVDARKTIGVDSRGGEMKRLIDQHNQLYCSDDDQARGRCSSPGDGLADADVNAGTLLAPESGETLSDEEYKASRAFVENVTNGMPVENLPASFEKTAAGKSYVLEQRHSAAQISMAQQALNKIIANRRVRN